MENNNAFEIIARGVYLKQGKILLCKRIDKNYWFLPGGHVEPGEKAQDALFREIREEMGASLTRAVFLGAMENGFFEENGDKYIHEINLIFHIKGSVNTITATEDHLEFRFIPLIEFAKTHFLPVVLKKELLRWTKTKKLFFGSQFSDLFQV